MVSPSEPVAHPGVETWLTVAEVQAILRVGRRTVYDFVARGLLAARRFSTGGRKWAVRIPLEAVRAFQAAAAEEK